LVVCTLLLAALFGGCANPDAQRATGARTPGTPQNEGEPAAPAPASPQSQQPAAIQPTPERALSAFARLYVNWSYRTLSKHQRSLAAISVAAARLSEREAATRSADDAAITRGQIHNSGQVVCVGRALDRSGWWVIVTREQTRGGADYAGLPAAYHVTLARLAEIGGGYAVEQWLPQS
jgi:hypothetical protein